MSEFPQQSLVDVPALIKAVNHGGFVVPRGVVHRARAPDRVVILMVEPAAIVPTGDG